MTFVKGNKINLGRKRPDMVGNTYAKGVIPWNKGLTKETDSRVLPLSKENIEASRLRITGNKYMLGKHMSEKNKMIMSARVKGKKYRLGTKASEKQKEIARKNWTGKNNPNWKGGITSKDRLERVKFKHTMQKQIFERDNYTCQMCNERGVDLQVDHIQSWAEYVDQRFNINNCRTLCKKCHYFITFGKEMVNKDMPWGHNLGRGINL